MPHLGVNSPIADLAVLNVARIVREEVSTGEQRVDEL